MAEKKSASRRTTEETVVIEITRQQAALLEQLVDTGLYGLTREHAAERLLSESLRRHFPRAFASTGFRP